KFQCAIAPGDEVKVKYGQANAEVYGEVAATRLLWALGFGADHMYPVTVECRDCPVDPARAPQERQHQVRFYPAAVERKMPGETGRGVGNIAKSVTGTLDHPVISEEGRAFLADLLMQLSDAQLHDLFAVARFPLRSLGMKPARPATTVDQWVEAFKAKRDEIV